MNRLLIPVLGLAAFFSVSLVDAANASKAGHCNRWHSVCLNTGGLASICSGRKSACMRTGCYHFNNPGPKCMADPKLTPAQHRALIRRK